MDTESQEVFDKHFDYVKFYLRPCGACCNKSVGVIDPVWKGVDRPIVGGWVHHNVKTAKRMVDAVYTGAAFSVVKRLVDVNKRTYIGTVSIIYWKQANADLKKLGY